MRTPHLDGAKCNQIKQPMSWHLTLSRQANGMRYLQHGRPETVSPGQGPATGMPYQGIANLRPESEAAVEEFLFIMKTPTM